MTIPETSTLATEMTTDDMRALSLSEIDDVSGGKFRYYMMNGDWYAVGTVNGWKVTVKVT